MVQDYWQEKLRTEARKLDSLSFFKTSFMSLSRPHPIWSTARYNPYETNKAVIQARMLSRRYRSEGLCRFWSTNTEGVCLLPACTNPLVKEDIVHILINCESLSASRRRLSTIFLNFAASNPRLSPIITKFFYTDDDNYKTQFLLDCSTLPEVIHLRQLHGFTILHELFHLTRTWCYSLHRDRLKILGRWSPIWLIWGIHCWISKVCSKKS